MDKVVARRLRPHEGRKLQQLKRQLSNAVNRRRARVILLSRGELCNQEIAQGVGLSPQWVRRIIHRFNDTGIEGITWYPYFCSCGEPRWFTPDVVERIGEVALSPPRPLIGMSVWSLAKLRDYLVEQGIIASISLEWLRQILRGCGTPRPGRTRTIPSSGQSTGESANSTTAHHRGASGFVWMSSGRSICSRGTGSIMPGPDTLIGCAQHTDARGAFVTSWASTTSIGIR